MFFKLSYEQKGKEKGKGKVEFLILGHDQKFPFIGRKKRRYIEYEHIYRWVDLKYIFLNEHIGT